MHRLSRRQHAARLIFTSIFFLAAPLLRAQTATGQINGTVTDQTGADVAGASVTLTNQATKVVERTPTNSNGYFVFINVQPGQYALDVTAKGFKSAEVPAFDIAVNQTMTQNLTLQLGAVTQTVEVTAQAPLLQASTANLGTAISEQAVKELPLNGRNFTQLMILTPGANPVSTAQGSGVSTTDAGVTAIPGTDFFKPSLHGQQNRSVLYYMDGIINTDFRGSIYGVEPIIDTVQEFKVQSHVEDTEYGNVLGGVVNLVTKSGTNQFHGSGWEFVRNNVFDARNPFKDFCNAARCGPNSNPTQAAPPAPYHQNEFGAAGGGPIIKNKTFFYAGYEGWRYSEAPLSLALVPTPLELSGDFSQSYYTQKIYNPYSTACGGTKCTVQPFAGQKIPTNLISPAMQAYIKSYYAQPNLTGFVGSNYIEARPHTDDSNNWQIRIDQNFNERNTMFFRLSQQWVTDNQPISGTVDMDPASYHAYDFGGGYDHIFSPNLIFDVRAGAMLKPYTFQQSVAANGFAAAASAGFQNLSQYGGMITTLGGPYTGSQAGQRGVSNRGNPGVNWDASINWIKGNHNIKAGAQFIYVNRLQNNLYQQFTFSDAQTSNLGAKSTGNSLASAMLGLPDNFTAENPQYAEVFFRFNVWAGYLEDQWKIRPNLTLTYGLRYSYLPKIVPLNSRLSNGLNLFSQQYLIGASSVPACGATFTDPCIPGGISSVPFNSHIVFTGEQSVGPPAVSDNWAPRAGLAWQFDPKTVLRLGYGIFYDTVSARSQYAQNDIEGATWPWTKGFNAQPENVSAGGIWPGGPGNPLTLITALEGNFPNPVVQSSPWTAGSYMDSPDFKDARSQQWNIGIERQFTPNTMLSFAYVGSKDTRLDYTGYANAAPHANPSGTPSSVIDAERLMPFMVNNWHYSQSIGISNYNALELEFQKRFSGGLMTLLSYTWSKSLDDSSGWFNAENGSGGGSVVQNYFTPMQNYGQSAYNIPQLLTWSTSYDLPFGRGKRWLNRGALSWILGNWEANYLFLARSGQPFTLGVNGDIANISGDGPTISGYGRPNLVGDPQSACKTEAAGGETCYFNPAAFAVPTDEYGNFGRDVLRDEPFYNVDFSLVKNIPFGESRSIQLRFESFNTFNFQILGTPGTTIGNSSAGVIQDIASAPRELQLGAKITF
ncbi:MAG: TonB-dependent receptor domain-containing protein [Bryobacteraceae bacterium]